MSVAPDIATVVFVVETRSEGAEAARRENESDSADVLDAIRALEVPRRAIRMRSLRLQPLREYDRENREYIDLGFEAMREIHVTVSDLDLLPELVAAVVSEGANRLERVQYDLENRDAATETALSDAVAQARRKAIAMTDALGAELGDVRSIDEQNFSFPQPVFRSEQLDSASAGGNEAAYSAGEIEVRAEARVVFELR